MNTIQSIRSALEAMSEPSIDVVSLLAPDAETQSKGRAAAQRKLRELARRYPELRTAATIALLIHFPRVGGASVGEFDRRETRPFTPAPAPVFEWCATSAEAYAAVRGGARGSWDQFDGAAAREGYSVDFLCDLNGTTAPEQPYVKLGRETEYARLLGRDIPAQNSAHRAAEHSRKFGRTAKPVEIVTRSDKARRAINRAARKLDVLEARIRSDASLNNPVTIAAVELVRRMLQVA